MLCDDLRKKLTEGKRERGKWEIASTRHISTLPTINLKKLSYHHLRLLLTSLYVYQGVAGAVGFNMAILFSSVLLGALSVGLAVVHLWQGPYAFAATLALLAVFGVCLYVFQPLATYKYRSIPGMHNWTMHTQSRNIVVWMMICCTYVAVVRCMTYERNTL